MSRDIKFIRLALEVAGLSNHKFPMGAVITQGSRIISVGTNKYKTHPLQRNHHTNELATSIHAELDAVLRAPYAKRRGSQISIARLLDDGTSGIARPCKFCRELLLDSGIYIVVYSMLENQFIKEDLRYGEKKLEENSF